MYEINVSQHGIHYFATAERSLDDLQTAICMCNHFTQAFPKEEGYEITLTRYETRGEEIDLHDTKHT